MKSVMRLITLAAIAATGLSGRACWAGTEAHVELSGPVAPWAGDLDDPTTDYWLKGVQLHPNASTGAYYGLVGSTSFTFAGNTTVVLTASQWILLTQVDEPHDTMWCNEYMDIDADYDLEHPGLSTRWADAADGHESSLATDEKGTQTLTLTGSPTTWKVAFTFAVSPGPGGWTVANGGGKYDHITTVTITTGS